ncbi:hypothetical protein C4B68_36625 [Streptomyces dengpaensis]|uniref:Uncharacterized protein n=1 Tax=Streptomyces dengpaensis TaxID=2049881 RepID=A0ABM6SZS7_9ACTN|nr:hypothetical protein C4B68_36625 [Streptomyces dengpaensis]PIB07677.1 hypothetical protein B1C81_19410 [Streptomyces sp. HG99]
MDERHEEPGADGVSITAVVGVLAPVLAGSAAALFLVSGYVLKLLSPTLAEPLLTGAWVFGALTAVALLLAVAGLLITAFRNGGSAVEETDAAPPSAPRHRPSSTGNGTLGFASFIAGRRRTHLREEWAAILAGDPEQGIVLSSRARMRYALGFLWAAIRLRIHDLVGPLWVPVDWLLSVESRTNGFIAAVVGTQAIYIVGHGGLPALVTEVWEPCGIVGGALCILARWLRRIRGIELATAGQDDAE